MALGRVILAAAALLVSAAPLSLAAEIGRAEINGRTIIIDDNGTWTYAEPLATGGAASGECIGGKLLKSRKVDVSLCIRDPWKIQSDATGGFEYNVFDIENEIYSGLVTERATMTIDALEYAIIYNAANATGVTRDQIPVVKRDRLQINGQDWRYVEYDVNFNGAEFRFGNYYAVLGQAGAVQVVFWCSKPYFDSNRSRIEALAQTLTASDKIGN